jgi:hypothetical protein
MFFTALLLGSAAVFLLVYGTSGGGGNVTAPIWDDPSKTGDTPDTSDVDGTYRAPENHAATIVDAVNPTLDETVRSVPLVGTLAANFGTDVGRALDAGQSFLDGPAGQYIPFSGHFTDFTVNGERFTREDREAYLHSDHPETTRLGKAAAAVDAQNVLRQETQIQQAIAEAVVLGQNLPNIPPQFHSAEESTRKEFLNWRKRFVESIQERQRDEGVTGRDAWEYVGRHLVRHDEDRPSTPPPEPDLSMVKNKPGSTKPTAQGGGTGRDVNDKFSHTGTLPGETQPVNRDGGH